MSNNYTLHILAALMEKSKHADVTLAYRQTLTKSLTYDLSSEVSMNMQRRNLPPLSADSESILLCAQQNSH